LKTLNAAKEKADTKEKELTNAEDQLSNPESAEEANKQKLEALLHEAQEHRDLKADLESQLQKIQGPHRAKERELESTRLKLEKADNKVASARRSLQNAREQMIERAGAAESEGARRAALLKQKEDELVIAQHKVQELTQAVSMSLRSYEAIEPQVSDAKNRTRSISNQLWGIRTTINELDRSSGESLAVWGKNVTRVAKLVR
jgi:chromosome segregation ATPase